MRHYFGKMRGCGRSQCAADPLEAAWSFIGAICGIGLVAWLCEHLASPSDGAILIGSFGASAVLAYGAPAGPLSQPRNLVGGACAFSIGRRGHVAGAGWHTLACGCGCRGYGHRPHAHDGHTPSPRRCDGPHRRDGKPGNPRPRVRVRRGPSGCRCIHHSGGGPCHQQHPEAQALPAALVVTPSRECMRGADHGKRDGASADGVPWECSSMKSPCGDACCNRRSVRYPCVRPARYVAAVAAWFVAIPSVPLPPPVTPSVLGALTATPEGRRGWRRRVSGPVLP